MVTSIQKWSGGEVGKRARGRGLSLKGFLPGGETGLNSGKKKIGHYEPHGLGGLGRGPEISIPKLYFPFPSANKGGRGLSGNVGVGTKSTCGSNRSNLKISSVRRNDEVEGKTRRACQNTKIINEKRYISLARPIQKNQRRTCK